MANNEIIETLQAGAAFVNRCIVETQTEYHSHNFVEIAYVASGEGIHTINGKSFAVKKGNIALINYDVPHQFCATESSLVVYNCIFTPSYFDSLLTGSRNFFDINNHFLFGNFYKSNAENNIDVIAGSNENAHILNIFERMLDEYALKQFGYKEIMRGYLIELLVMIFRLWLQTPNHKSHKILDALDYIHTHFTQDIPLEALAAMSNASITNFCRIFKSATGKTVTQYIQTLRIEEACRLLSATDQNVIEIANNVGYSDIKHFYNIFKRITHKVPKDFR